MKTTFALSTVLTVLLGVCVAGPASAESPPAADFQALDTNTDMYIDKQEFEQFFAKMREARSERFGGGRRGAGKDRSERMAQLYDDADTDGDTLLDETEYAALQDAIRSRRDQMRQRWRGDRQQD